MGPGGDQTHDLWICSQTRICCQTRYRLRYATRFFNALKACFENRNIIQLKQGISENDYKNNKHKKYDSLERACSLCKVQTLYNLYSIHHRVGTSQVLKIENKYRYNSRASDFFIIGGPKWPMEQKMVGHFLKWSHPIPGMQHFCLHRRSKTT